jgi:hypothetical protein
MFPKHRRRPPFSNRAYPSARDIAARLGGDADPYGSGNYACHCPGPIHENGDKNPSLSVKDGKSGKPIFYCHAGCDFREVIGALEHMGVLPRRGR